MEFSCTQCNAYAFYLINNFALPPFMTFETHFNPSHPSPSPPDCPASSSLSLFLPVLCLPPSSSHFFPNGMHFQLNWSPFLTCQIPTLCLVFETPFNPNQLPPLISSSIFHKTVFVTLHSLKSHYARAVMTDPFPPVLLGRTPFLICARSMILYVTQINPITVSNNF